MSFKRAFKRSREANPGKIAIAFGDESWTYSEFDQLTDNLARNLLYGGAEPGDRIALHMLNSPDLALAYIGCLKAGCILVPLNTRLKGREIDYVLRHSGSAHYLGQPDLYAEAAGSCPAIAALDRRFLSGEKGDSFISSFDDLLQSPAHSVPLPEIASDHVAAIVYTSGTTSHPKGVVHTHETLIQMARAMREMHLDERQTVLIITSMAHLVGLGMLLTSGLLNGATTVITRPFDFSGSLEAHERWRCTYTLGFPAMFRSLLDAQMAGPRDIHSAGYFFCGGDSVTPSLQEAFQSSFAPICEVYGLTEVAPASWNRTDDIHIGSIGKPGAGVVFRLLDSNGSEVPTGAVGEICIRAPHLMKGYWQDATATAAAYHDGWFRTGDLARRDNDGFYWFTGRKKEIIIRGGSNISPQEVEAVLSEHPAVAEAGVVGRPDPFWGQTVVAHVALRLGKTLDEAALITFVRERLADYKTPETVIFHDELPKGLTGKIQRRALRESEYAFAAEAAS